MGNVSGEEADVRGPGTAWGCGPREGRTVDWTRVVVEWAEEFEEHCGSKEHRIADGFIRVGKHVKNELEVSNFQNWMDVVALQGDTTGWLGMLGGIGIRLILKSLENPSRKTKVATWAQGRSRLGIPTWQEAKTVQLWVLGSWTASQPGEEKIPKDLLVSTSPIKLQAGETTRG